MKRTFLVLLIALVPVICLAGLKAVSFHVTNASTNTTASTDVSGKVRGEVIKIEIYTDTTSSVRFVTSTNTGASISGAKTILGYTDVTNGLSTYAASTNMYLYGDIITMSVTGAVSSTEEVKALIILDDDE